MSRALSASREGSRAGEALLVSAIVVAAVAAALLFRVAVHPERIHRPSHRAAFLRDAEALPALGALQEPGQVRQFPVVHVPDGPLRDLLLPRARPAPRACRRLRGGRYQTISSDLKHDLAFKIPLVLFKTQAEFQQQNVIPGDVPEGVAAFAEPQRDRMVLPIDEPPDQLYRLITPELTHIFEFDIIPRSLIRRNVPLWVDEGLADYLAGVWRPLDLMTVRDLAVSESVPKMSEIGGLRRVHQRPDGLQPRPRHLRVHRVRWLRASAG